MSLTLGFHSQAQTASPGFPKGDLSFAKNHTGNIRLSELNVGDSTFDIGVAMATYDPGAKLDWHMHPGGQVLHITEGSDLSEKREAVSGRSQGETVWLEPVSEQAYKSLR